MVIKVLCMLTRDGHVFPHHAKCILRKLTMYVQNYLYIWTNSVKLHFFHVAVGWGIPSRGRKKLISKLEGGRKRMKTGRSRRRKPGWKSGQESGRWAEGMKGKLEKGTRGQRQTTGRTRTDLKESRREQAKMHLSRVYSPEPLTSVGKLQPYLPCHKQTMDQ